VYTSLPERGREERREEVREREREREREASSYMDICFYIFYT